MKNKILILLIALLMTVLFTGCGAKKATLIFVTYSESVIEPIEVTADGIDSLVIPEPTKEGFGSLILDKWGAIGYNEKAIRLTMVGSNSGASVAFRIVERGSYKIYSCSITDNFEGEKTFTVPMSEFSGDGEILYQQIMQVEITITHARSTTVTILEARFVDAE